MQYDETRLAGTYGSDIDPLDDIQVEDAYPDIDYDFDMDEPVSPAEDDNYLTGDYDFDYNDEPYLWQDEIDDVTEDFPF